MKSSLIMENLRKTGRNAREMEQVVFWGPEALMDDFTATYMASMERYLEFPITGSSEEWRSLSIDSHSAKVIV